MKKGFTLLEVLIALGIVGILAAILLPLMNNIKPDKDKIMYLKTYDTISQVVMDLGKGRNYNSSTREINGIDVNYTKIPFYNIYDENGNSDLNKLGKLIANAFGVDDPSVSNNTVAFTAPQGVEIVTETTYAAPTVQSETEDNIKYVGHYVTRVRFNNHTMNIYADGSIHPDPSDQTGASYLNSRGNWTHSQLVAINSPNVSDEVVINIPKTPIEDPEEDNNWTARVLATTTKYCIKDNDNNFINIRGEMYSDPVLLPPCTITVEAASETEAREKIEGIAIEKLEKECWQDSDIDRTDDMKLEMADPQVEYQSGPTRNSKK